MIKVLVIGEKTSQVKKFVSVLLKNTRTSKEGKMVYSYSGSWTEGNITYDLCFLPLTGHISSIDTEKGFGWKETPPISIVTNPKALVVKYQAKYRNIINRLATNMDQIWLATDPDSEGDNIAHEALTLALNRNPELSKSIKRIWNSSLTKNEIIRAFKNRKTYDDKLALAVQGRRYADAWLGFAATREITFAARKVMKLKVMSVGRVQLPTLKKIVDRDAKIEAFVPVTKWNLDAVLDKEGNQFKASHVSNPFDDEKKANNILSSLKNEKTASITEIIKKDSKIPPPIPLNTTAALALLTSRLKITANVALSTMEDLYLNGYLSYPRTDNTRFKPGFPHDDILTKLSSNNTLNIYIKQIKDSTQVRRNGKKQGAEDHDPIHPTGEIPTNLKDLAKKTWDLLARYYVGLFMDDHVVSKTRVTLTIGNEVFVANGNITKSPGWTRAINWKSAREKHLPLLKKGDIVPIKELQVEKFKTKPLPRWTDARILKEMERLKIGTKSSRPGILNKLILRNYVIRQKTSLLSTEQGRILVNVLTPIWPEVVGPKFTRHVEEHMDQVAMGKQQYTKMLDQLRDEYIDLHHLLQSKISDLQGKLKEVASSGDLVDSKTYRRKKTRQSSASTGIKCPKCGAFMVMRKNKKTGESFYGCQAYPKCHHTRPVKIRSKTATKSKRTAKKEKKKPETAITNKENSCPRCDGTLITRTNRKSGEKFKGCSNFPVCTFTSKIRKIK
ncbi:MAG: DNA topoisomerase [Candidatus Hodarchaeales archaeon]